VSTGSLFDGRTEARVGDHAHARASDPQTSHDAAAAITPGLPEIQAKVERWAIQAGARGFTDLAMCDAMEDSTSTLRSRRAELTDRNIILDTGQRRTEGDSPRERIVWVHRSYFVGAPPICEPAKPITSADKAEARSLSIELARLAKGFRSQGLGIAADKIDEGARLLGRLAG